MAKKKRSGKVSASASPSQKEAAKRSSSSKWLIMTGMALCIAAVLFLARSENTESKPVEYKWKVVNKFPHDMTAYTQGFFYRNGQFYESTGGMGKSTVRRVDPQTGSVLRIRNMASNYFGEGLAFYKGVLWQITWENGEAIVYDSDTLEPIRTYSYQGPGWGLTTDGEHLIMSDGTDKIVFRDPKNFQILRSMKVTAPWPVSKLNELEYINGEIWANVYQTNYVLRISPETGKVLGRINFSGILEREDRHGGEDVLNGIAWDEGNKRLFITGKYYGKVYEVVVQE